MCARAAAGRFALMINAEELRFMRVDAARSALAWAAWTALRTDGGTAGATTDVSRIYQ